MNVLPENSCTVTTEQHAISRNLLIPGNIIPHCWYKSFTVKGCPDFTSIIILADIVAWWRNSDKIISFTNSKLPDFNGKSLSISYEYLYDKFGFNKETARRAFVRLEKAQTLTRQVKNIKSENGTYVNRLYIILNQTFYQSCFRSPEYDIRALPHNKASVLSNARKDTTPNDDKLPSPLKCGDHISNKIQSFKNRSRESNFVESDSKEGKGISLVKAEQAAKTVPLKPTVTSVVDKIKAKFTGKKRVSIVELAPITDDEACKLRLGSNREFNVNYMNKLKERLAKKYPEHGFFTRASFLKYMTKALANELREAIVVNNESFNFKQNADKLRIENYLRAIEESKCTDKTTQLRKKIAARFDNKLSYEILTNCNFVGNLNSANIFEIQLRSDLAISEFETSGLLAEVRAVFGEQISDLKFILLQNAGNLLEPSDIKPTLNLGKEGTIWHKVSTNLLHFYGENLHRAWFSKLEAVEDVNRGCLILKTPSEFIKSWIETNYKVVIERFCREENCNLDEVLV